MLALGPTDEAPVGYNPTWNKLYRHEYNTVMLGRVTRTACAIFGGWRGKNKHYSSPCRCLVVNNFRHSSAIEEWSNLGRNKASRGATSTGGSLVHGCWPLIWSGISDGVPHPLVRCRRHQQNSIGGPVQVPANRVRLQNRGRQVAGMAGNFSTPTPIGNLARERLFGPTAEITVQLDSCLFDVPMPL